MLDNSKELNYLNLFLKRLIILHVNNHARINFERKNNQIIKK